MRVFRLISSLLAVVGRQVRTNNDTAEQKKSESVMIIIITQMDLFFYGRQMSICESKCFAGKR